jgi:hypothetical protein
MNKNDRSAALGGVSGSAIVTYAEAESAYWNGKVQTIHVHTAQIRDAN